MMVKADASRIQQVMVNLVSNAVRYGAQGKERKVNVRVDIALPQPDGSMPPPPTPSPQGPAEGRQLEDGDRAYLFVSVSDTGPGMTEEQQSRLFCKFSQTGSSSAQTGLGLYIAKNLCDLQGGCIHVTSTSGGGSTFVACFEIRAVVAPPVDRSASQPATASPPGLRKALRILAVDDNIISRKILRRQLLQEGHDCSLANDGQEALVSRSLLNGDSLYSEILTV
jgi:anti-sigma regulatory factor (Ser/Thr protein kinase)